MDRAEQLTAIDDIRQLKARYFRFIDCKQWDRLPSVFAPDLQVVTPEGRIWLEGGEAYAASLRFGLEHATSCHMGLTSEITITGLNSATGIWAMHDNIQWPDRHPREGWKAIVGYGHYHESYRREDREWRIARLSLTRVRLDITWPEGVEP